MNQEEGKRAFQQGKRALMTGNIQEGLKYLKISQRLLPSEETVALIQQYSNSTESSRSPTSPASAPSASPASASTTSPQEHSFQTILNYLQDFGHVISEKFLQFETKYIAPSTRQFIRVLFLIILCLIIIKYVFKQEIGIGHLPGDISYSSSNTFISAPFVSCLLVSFLFNGLVRAFQP